MDKINIKYIFNFIYKVNLSIDVNSIALILILLLNQIQTIQAINWKDFDKIKYKTKNSYK
jgi:hypothetical protein